MNLLEQTRKICELYDINPARSRGQNFLINEDIYEKILDEADLNKNDIVLEVGPGLGFLTERIARKVKKVIAVELDDKLADLLKTRLLTDKIDNVELVNKDIIDVIRQSTIDIPQSYKVVANLPYNISSIFLRTVFELKNKPSSLTLMLQKEVAERIVADRGEMSLLAVSVQLYAEGKIITKVPGSDFWPSPEVDSAVIKLELKKEKIDIDEKKFFQLVKFGFSAKRKMLKNNLAGGFRITHKEAEDRIVKAGFQAKTRAQELSVDDWKKVLREFEDSPLES